MTRSYPSRISRKNAAQSLALLLHGCTPERLRSFTVEELTKTHKVRRDQAEQMLAQARAGRGM